ncbi:hypothetical protein CUMW_222580, partial [Citrus unshiu]
NSYHQVSDVTDSILQETFSRAKFIIDSNTGHTKGYGFVRFGDENERSRAMIEMNGSDGESNNATIFVGALDSNVSDKDLRELFSHFGEILSVKIPVGKGCGFVQFANRKDAEVAL